ncbi:hypothetical protein D0B54_14150 [Solimonas sp. K1W22B-7]|uniref:hypothetical protein n=1 Tax=Solimonas sp. K1W22B-7 TaxID=2303331 RepID=UPI000E3354D0|nr:hypothetical protein [Solimonas sp. K1W22B-7]AXQ29745.1 hypothetical protein D0B54_14150 [Solimonas sp. K1W22B-7]
MPEGASAGVVSTPARGSSMATVTKQFGQPSVKHPSKGGGSAVHPPITRWDYADFSVFFERSTVIDVVVRGAPMPIQNKDELQSVSP